MRTALTGNPGTSDMHTRPGLFSVRPALYIIILALSVCAAYAYKLRTDGIFACPADGYTADRYLAYCNAVSYGDYDHGAFWFGLEPEARRHASAAEVLFVGSSRMQFGFSTAATTDWFTSTAASYYLLGFSHTGNVRFLEPLLEKLTPGAKVYVINVDRFFDTRESPPVAEIFHGDDVENRYDQKQSWQLPHRAICTLLPIICGNRLSMFRSRQNGSWVLKGAAELETVATSTGAADNQDQWADFAALGKSFISKLPVEPDCILLTIVPTVETKRDEAAAIARALGLDLIAPNPGGLVTYDGSHLDLPSRERWAAAFFSAAGPRIQRCLNASGTS